MKKILILFAFFICVAEAHTQTVRTRQYFHDLFITGYKPTQTNYRDLWVSLFWPNQDSMAINRIIGVDHVSNNPTLSDSSAWALPTEAAVKAYVDAAMAAGISDGDKGQITVSNLGSTWNVNNGAITAAHLSTTGASTGDAFVFTGGSWQLVQVARIKGVYQNDSAAGAGGVQIGERYELGVNPYGQPPGTIRTRKY